MINVISHSRLKGKTVICCGNPWTGKSRKEKDKKKNSLSFKALNETKRN